MPIRTKELEAGFVEMSKLIRYHLDNATSHQIMIDRHIAAANRALDCLNDINRRLAGKGAPRCKTSPTAAPIAAGIPFRPDTSSGSSSQRSPIATNAGPGGNERSPL